MRPNLKRVETSDLVEGRTYQNNPNSKPWVLKKFVFKKHQLEAYLGVDYLDGSGYFKSKYQTERYFYEVQNKGESTMINQLYQIKDKDVYGYKLATNSQGKIVFEVKGTAEVLTVDKNELIKVVPYTVACSFNDGKTTLNFLSSLGAVEVGDVVVSGHRFYIVQKLNTQYEGQADYLTGKVLGVTKELKEE